MVDKKITSFFNFAKDIQHENIWMSFGSCEQIWLVMEITDVPTSDFRCEKLNAHCYAKCNETFYNKTKLRFINKKGNNNNVS